MNDLRIMNSMIFNKYNSLKLTNISAPCIVSSKRFKETISSEPIMYIGQETNEWVNYKETDISLDIIEDEYDSFYIDYGTTKTQFWRFLKKATGIDYQDFHKSIIWCNTLIFGRQHEKGTPKITEEVKQMSIDYLLFLYNYFKPSKVIIVAGPNNPYYEIINSFLKEINSSLIVQYPTTDKYLITDDEKNIIWTYHPNRLNFTKHYNEAANLILKKIRK